MAVKVMTVDVMLDHAHGLSGSYSVVAYDAQGRELSRQDGTPVRWVPVAAHYVAQEALQPALEAMHNVAAWASTTAATVLRQDMAEEAAGEKWLQEKTDLVDAFRAAMPFRCASCADRGLDGCDDCPDHPEYPAQGIGGGDGGEFRKQC